MKNNLKLLSILLAVVISSCYSCSSDKSTANSDTIAEKQDGTKLALQHQLTNTSYYGKEDAVEVAKHRVDLLLQIVNGFGPSKTQDKLENLQNLTNDLYAGDALVFQSQPFIDSVNLGGKAFLSALEFINVELGKGNEFLEPQNVCGIYAFRPQENTGEVHWVMTTAAYVPQYGQVLNTVLMKARKSGNTWKVIYHDYLAPPAGGEDCNGAQAKKIYDEWKLKVE